MPVVAISVDCEAANAGKCYTRELVKVAEEFTIPLTWLLYVSQKNPMSNVHLYHTEYFHRIPAWHEMGLLLAFDSTGGYISDPRERASLVRMGKDVLKQCHVKPTSFRAHRFDLLPTDLKHIEDIGILVDASACPGAEDKHGVRLPEGPTQPYYPSYDNLATPGDAAVLMAPIATRNGVAGYLDRGWQVVEQVVEGALEADGVVALALTDTVDNVDALRLTVERCRAHGARFVTLTQLAAL
ncbi:MAG TPA: hypothetical protein VLH79_02035 [Chthonomonadales bacterium]|nr:hypothetical protein [Chthonomonadales bacterium]